LRPDQGPGLHLAKGPAVTGWHVCPRHGAGGGAPADPANGRWRDGGRSRSAKSHRRESSDLAAEARKVALALSQAFFNMGLTVA